MESAHPPSRESEGCLKQLLIALGVALAIAGFYLWLLVQGMQSAFDGTFEGSGEPREPGFDFDPFSDWSELPLLLLFLGSLLVWQ